ncbi:hypothetical protein [Endozoicomonas sp.]|uniref:hypothetical protein n=1 Tax=Endozoicomonas sp. TaxID=1892382 RepID=UPI002883BC83|nr:hypothetical protein [Endozoicomonas sp.]
MKTEALLNITTPNELTVALSNMTTEEHEKHARQLAEKLKLDYDNAFVDVASLIKEGDDANNMVTLVSQHLLALSHQAFKDEDEALLHKYPSSQNDTEPGPDQLCAGKERDIATVERELAASNLKLAGEQLALIRAKRALVVAIFAILVLMILPTRSHVIQESTTGQEPSTSDA